MPASDTSLRRVRPAEPGVRFLLVDLLRPALVDVPALQAGLLNLLGLAVFGAAGLAVAARCFRWEPWR